MNLNKFKLDDFEIKQMDNFNNQALLLVGICHMLELRFKFDLLYSKYIL